MDESQQIWGHPAVPGSPNPSTVANLRLSPGRLDLPLPLDSLETTLFFEPFALQTIEILSIWL
jgi:hypothetical protein